jgi:hypothetical protein
MCPQIPVPNNTKWFTSTKHNFCPYKVGLFMRHHPKHFTKQRILIRSQGGAQCACKAQEMGIAGNSVQVANYIIRKNNGKT